MALKTISLIMDVNTGEVRRVKTEDELWKEVAVIFDKINKSSDGFEIVMLIDDLKRNYSISKK